MIEKNASAGLLTRAGSGTISAAGALSRVGPRLGSAVGIALVASAAVLVVAVGVGPRIFPYKTYSVQGGSMSPTIPMGAEIVLRPVRANKLEVGDVITFRRPGQLDQLVTHRIVRIEQTPRGRRFATKGDANAVPDSWRVPATGTGWREVFAVPYVGYLVQGFQAPFVRFGIVVLLAIALATFVLRRIWATTEA